MINHYPLTVAKSIDLQQLCQANFGVDLTIERIVASDLSSGKDCTITVFETTSHDFYAYCDSTTPLTLRDVKRLMRRAGIKASLYMPPVDQPHYFTRFSVQAFNAAFPGRALHADDDLTFYESLAPYTPALVKVAEISGELREYRLDSRQWQKVLDFSYKRIAVSL